MKKILAVLFLLSAAGMVHGQLMETPVPFDSAGKILEWTPKLESRAGLFPGIVGFKSAVLWKADTTYVLEMTTAQGRLRKSLTGMEFDSLMITVGNFLNTTGSLFALNQEGRGAYLLWQIPLSLGWYGPAVLALTEPENGSTAAGLYLTSAAATYFIPFMLTKNRQITSGQEHLSIAYGFRGIYAGAAISALLFDMDDSRTSSAIMLATSIGGQVAGYKWGAHFTKPQGRIISHYATFGAMDLLLLFNTIQEKPKDRLMAAGTLAGLAGGTYLGYRLAKGQNISDGEPTIVATSGWTGMAAGAGLYLCAFSRGDSDDIDMNQRLFNSFCLLGNAAGLYLGHKFTKGYSFTRGDGFIVAGTTTGGALLGAGIGFLCSPHKSDNGMLRLISGASTVGMLGGYYLGLKTVRNQEHKRLSRLNINFDGIPLGLALAASRTRTRIPWITGSF